jgi:hypothetical protein
VKKVIEINNCLLGTMAGGAAVRLHRGPLKETVSKDIWMELRVLIDLRVCFRIANIG